MGFKHQVLEPDLKPMTWNDYVKAQMDREKQFERILRKNAPDLQDTSMYISELDWSLPELFIRQYLNNCCDGFGLKNVERMYDFIKRHKDIVVREKMIHEKGWNNSGYILWEDYEF